MNERSADRARLAATLRQLAEIPEAELGRALDLFRPASLRRDEHLLRAGEVPATIAFLVSGILRLYYLDEAGNEYTKSFCCAPDLVGAYSALLLDEPSRLFIQALEDASLLVADYGEYRRLAAGHGCWQTVNLRIAETLFIKKEKREAALLLDDAEARYRQFQAEYPRLEGRVRQRHIASYLGITPVSLSRIRARRRKLT